MKPILLLTTIALLVSSYVITPADTGELTYTYKNKNLPHIQADFTVNIQLEKDSMGKYQFAKTTYNQPDITNKGTSSFQPTSINSAIIDSGRTYYVTATGNYVKENIDFGTTTVSAFFYLNTETGEITKSYT